MFINNFQSAKVNRKNGTTKLFSLILVKIFEKIFITSLTPFIFSRLRFFYSHVLLPIVVCLQHTGQGEHRRTPHRTPYDRLVLGYQNIVSSTLLARHSPFLSKNSIKNLTIQIKIVKLELQPIGFQE